jgi:polar amino acid transport system substrate-binding protein
VYPIEYSLAIFSGMLEAILDVSGKILVAIGWQDICTKFHRYHPDTLKNCIESDTILAEFQPDPAGAAAH